MKTDVLKEKRTEMMLGERGREGSKSSYKLVMWRRVVEGSWRFGVCVSVVMVSIFIVGVMVMVVMSGRGLENPVRAK